MFLFKLSILASNPDFQKSLIIFFHILGFILANSLNAFFGFFLCFISFKNPIKIHKINKDQIQFANFVYKFSYIAIFGIIFFFNYNYIGQIYLVFLGYSIFLLKIFKKPSEFKKFIIFFSLILICAKLLNIYLFIKNA
jgi:hypothetical protein